MKVSLLAGVAVAALVLAAPQASAGTYKPYVSVFGGASLLSKDLHGTYNVGSQSFDILTNNPGYIIGGAVGVDWGNQIRTELELSHAHWTSDKYDYTIITPNSFFEIATSSNMSATYLLGNAWLDIGNRSGISPYVGGGLGIGWANVNAFTNTVNDQFSASGLAFQLGAGVRFNVNDSVSIDAGYRFKDIVGLSYNTAGNSTLTDTSLASHNFQIGLTYQF
jgi:opacity protein-like surface antigen